MAKQGTPPAAPDDRQHEKARELGEEALGELAKGNEKRADALIGQAKKLDESALREIVEDLDEDAGSNPAAAAGAKEAEKREPG
jgi:hypothetical protein